VVSSVQVFCLKLCMHLSSFPSVLYAPPIPPSIIITMWLRI
jgi:hypothetical protein